MSLKLTRKYLQLARIFAHTYIAVRYTADPKRETAFHLLGPKTIITKLTISLDPSPQCIFDQISYTLAPHRQFTLNTRYGLTHLTSNFPPSLHPPILIKTSLRVWTNQSSESCVSLEENVALKGIGGGE